LRFHLLAGGLVALGFESPPLSFGLLPGGILGSALLLDLLPAV